MKRPFFSSLRGRFLILLLFLTALPALALGILSYRESRKTIEQRVRNSLVAIVDLKQRQVENWLDAGAADALLQADNFLTEEHFSFILEPEAPPDQKDAFAGFLRDNLISMQKAREGYLEILFVDQEGKVILSTSPAHEGQDFSNYPGYIQAMHAGYITSTSDIFAWDEGTSLEMAFSHPLHRVDLTVNQETEEIAGAVIIRVDVRQTLFQLIGDWPDKGQTGTMLLVRQSGDGVDFLNMKGDQPGELFIHLPDTNPDMPVAASSRGLEGVERTLDYQGVDVLTAYRTISRMGWGLVAKQESSEAFAPVLALSREEALIGLIVLIIAVLVSTVLSKTLTAPLSHLAEASLQLAEGNDKISLPKKRKDEIGDLTASFQQMIEKVSQSRQQLLTHSRELEALNDLSQKFLSSTNSFSILKDAMHQSILGTKADAGAVLLVDETEENLTLVQVEGLPDEWLEQRFPMDGSTAPGYALQCKEPVFASDLDIADFRVPPMVEKYGVKSVLSVPLVVKDKAVGAIVTHTFQQRPFEQDEIHVAESIANQTALALERVGLFHDLQHSYDLTLEALVAALDARDRETEGHSRRVVIYTVAIAKQMNIPDEDLTVIRRGALLHDIGKIGVPDHILHKPGPLDDAEWQVMRQHPPMGENILRGIPFLKEPLQIVCAHHERWDGKGYPRGLKGEAIPIGARIFSIADTFDAITVDRPYRAAQPYEKACSEIKKNSGTQFDPRAVQAFLEIPESEWDVLRLQALKPLSDYIQEEFEDF